MCIEYEYDSVDIARFLKLITDLKESTQDDYVKIVLDEVIEDFYECCE